MACSSPLSQSSAATSMASPPPGGRYYQNNLLLPWADAQERCCHINGEPNPLANPKLCIGRDVDVDVG
eukprot:scaffold90067_cov29-Phaeocystis_antarctica.AAC.1